MISLANQSERKHQKEKAFAYAQKMRQHGKGFVEEEEDSDIYTVEHIVDKKKEGKKAFYLVKWENYPHSQNTWEPVQNLANVRDLVKKFNKQYEATQLMSNMKEQSTAGTVQDENIMINTTAHHKSTKSKDLTASDLLEAQIRE